MDYLALELVDGQLIGGQWQFPYENPYPDNHGNQRELDRTGCNGEWPDIDQHHLLGRGLPPN